MLNVISGHAPGHIRNEFETLAEDRSAWLSPEMRRLIGKLWNCTDIMPSMLCAELDEPAAAPTRKGSGRFASTFALTTEREPEYGPPNPPGRAVPRPLRAS